MPSVPKTLKLVLMTLLNCPDCKYILSELASIHGESVPVKVIPKGPSATVAILVFNVLVNCPD